MKKRKIWTFVILGLFALALLQIPKNLEAAAKYVRSTAWDAPKTVQGITFVAKSQKVGSRYLSKIMMTKNKKSTTILSGVEADFVTNGKLLYYSKPTKQINSYSWRNSVYCYNIASAKSRKIVSGADYTVCGCSGTYLYCGTDEYADGVDLYAVNVKTKKKRHMVAGVGSLIASNGKVVTTTNSGDTGNYPIYVFNYNGSGKKKIANGTYGTIKNGKIYYTQFNQKICKLKVYRCTLNGKNKKAVTGWVSRIPSKYL